MINTRTIGPFLLNWLKLSRIEIFVVVTGTGGSLTKRKHTAAATGNMPITTIASQ